MTILDFANSLPDHRQQAKVHHKACDIVFITVASVICGAQDWHDVACLGECKEDFFRKHLELPNGIPSHDTFNRFFAQLDTEAMEAQFRQWTHDLCSATKDLVSIDGKTIRGAKVGSKSPFHMVSAFCRANGISLGQVKTSEKSNEITAIPLLIEALDLRECMVSIDAMGCQTSIAKKIREKGGDYLLAVKNNQGELYQAIEDTFRLQPKKEECYATETDSGHGRIETRTCYISRDLSFIDTDKWQDAGTLIKVVSDRYIKKEQKQEETAIRYYISSANKSAESFNQYVRSHWGIENNLHWELDVSMGEDASKKKAGNSPMNFSVICKTVLAILKKYVPSDIKNTSIKRKRKMAGWADKYLLEMMGVET
jgi:predicted transposase YbfD/YdcC